MRGLPLPQALGDVERCVQVGIGGISAVETCIGGLLQLLKQHRDGARNLGGHCPDLCRKGCEPRQGRLRALQLRREVHDLRVGRTTFGPGGRRCSGNLSASKRITQIGTEPRHRSNQDGYRLEPKWPGPEWLRRFWPVLGRFPAELGPETRSDGSGSKNDATSAQNEPEDQLEGRFVNPFQVRTHNKK